MKTLCMKLPHAYGSCAWVCFIIPCEASCEKLLCVREVKFGEIIYMYILKKNFT